MLWVCTYLRDDLYISTVLSSVVRTIAVKLVKHAFSIESVHICSSLSVEAAYLLYNTQDSVM